MSEDPFGAFLLGTLWMTMAATVPATVDASFDASVPELAFAYLFGLAAVPVVAFLAYNLGRLAMLMVEDVA